MYKNQRVLAIALRVPRSKLSTTEAIKSSSSRHRVKPLIRQFAKSLKRRLVQRLSRTFI